MPRTKPQSEETKRKISESVKARRAEKDWWKGRKHTDETKDKQSRNYRRFWDDPLFSSKMSIAQAKRPTKPEIELEQFLTFNWPHQWRYTGDGRLLVAGVNPDFVNIAGQPKIIELFGEYWHVDQEEQSRIDYFAKENFSCLVIWVKELKDKEALRQKIEAFTNG